MARENIDDLLDPDSFVEYGMLARPACERWLFYGTSASSTRFSPLSRGGQPDMQAPNLYGKRCAATARP